MKQAPPSLIASRKDYHGSIAPAVYSHHALSVLARDIDSLPIPKDDFTRIEELGGLSVIQNGLELNYEAAKEYSRCDGVSKLAEHVAIHYWGYGDRHFVPMFASALGSDIGRLLLNEQVIETPLSFTDYAHLFQTGWFGDIANSLALTGQGRIQPNLNLGSITGRPVSHLARVLKRGFYSDIAEPLVLAEDEESGRVIVKASDELVKVFRGGINRDESVGCPVARTSFTATSEQAAFLESAGHINSAKDGVTFHDVGAVGQSGRVKISQGVYTAIDHVLWHWGSYVGRYAESRLDNGADPLRYAATSANETVLLD
jgi:hypothetical protein